MSFSKKIDEWMKEAEARPESALTIVKLISRRLRELTERNEELLAENIALQNGTRVEEYQKRIAHLEYQLDLLKRRFGTEDISLLETVPDFAEASSLNLLAYNANGRIIRLEIGSDTQSLGRITDETINEGEPPRLLGARSHEEVLLLFTSGRVSTLAVSQIPALDLGGAWSWEQAALPDEPRAGEILTCITPLSRLPLSAFFLQVSRRGCVKKTMTTMAESVLANHFLGRGALQKSDQAFEITLCQAKERLAFVTYEGRLLGLDVDGLSYTAEDRINIPASDYVVASLITHPEESLLFITQTGKVVHRESEGLELSKSASAKGQALISPARLDQGIRFIGAASVRNTDRIAVLDARGNLNVYSAEAITGAGSIEAAGLILSIGVIPSEGGKRPAS